MIQLLGLLISVAAMVFHVLEKGSNGFRSPRSTSNLLSITSTNSLASMPLSASFPELNEQVHHEEGRHHSRSSSINIVNNSDP